MSTAAHVRRTSVYTIRLHPTHASRVEALRDAVEAHAPVVDVGALSVSYRVPTDDAEAMDVAYAAVAALPENRDGIAVAFTVTTGLGVHRRTVTP